MAEACRGRTWLRRAEGGKWLRRAEGGSGRGGRGLRSALDIARRARPHADRRHSMCEHGPSGRLVSPALASHLRRLEAGEATQLAIALSHAGLEPLAGLLQRVRRRRRRRRRPRRRWSSASDRVWAQAQTHDHTATARALHNHADEHSILSGAPPAIAACIHMVRSHRSLLRLGGRRRFLLAGTRRPPPPLRLQLRLLLLPRAWRATLHAALEPCLGARRVGGGGFPSTPELSVSQDFSFSRP